MVTGEFADTVNLSPGDYYLAWASEAKVEVQSFNTGADQVALMNADGDGGSGGWTVRRRQRAT
jgi:hypothetical protein